MSLIAQTIRNFVAGISQQPDVLRHPEQLDEQINGFSTEASGLQKRPPTQHLFRLGSTAVTGVKPLVHIINRDTSEKYVAVFTGNGVDVYDVRTGALRTVNYDGNSRAYLSTASPRKVLKCATVADYTFILNNTVVSQMSGACSPNKWASQGVLVNVKSGQYGRTYRIVIDGAEVASFTTPDGSDKSHTAQIATDNIVGQLASQCSAKGCGVATGSSWIYIEKGGGISNCQVFDGYNNQAMFGILRKTQKFTNLPASAPDGFICEIAGEKGSNTDDYYVVYNASDNIWKETLRPNIQISFNKATMPHVLVREADGTFTFREAEWADRQSGDDDSNPLPSFIGYTINDTFFYRNRLGLLAEENVILTASADFFNFWIASATELQDTDPIDMAVSSNFVATLYHAVPFNSECFLFAQDTQFALSSSAVLSPKDAMLDTKTNFRCSKDVRPIGAGRNIYYPVERSEFTSISEYFTAQDNTGEKDSQDISTHIPSYIHNGVYKMIGSTVEHMVLSLSEGEPDAVYVYKYLFIDGVRQQASWSKWKLGGSIVGGDFIDAYLYLVVTRNGSYWLERISFATNTTEYTDEPYRVLLDRKVSYVIPTSAYNPVTEKTVINVMSPYGLGAFDAGKTYGIVTTKGVYVETNSPVVELEGNYGGQEVFIGECYEFKAVLSKLYIRKTDNGSTQTVTTGHLQLQNIILNCSDTGYFKVEVDLMSKKQVYTYMNTANRLSSANTLLGQVHFSDCEVKIPLHSINTDCKITVRSLAPQPVALLGAKWQGNYNTRVRDI